MTTKSSSADPSFTKAAWTAGICAFAASIAAVSPVAAQVAAAQEAEAVRLEADVRFLADDLLEGREAGTRGYDLAAKFVAERFRALGLEPAGGDGTYFQKVPMIQYGRVEDFGGTLTFSGDDAPSLSLGAEYIVNASAKKESGVVEAPVVFAGFGLVAPEHGRDDFSGLEVDGKIVMLLAGAPKLLNSEERAHYGRTSIQRASERGAVGVIRIWTETLENRYPYERLKKNAIGDTGMSWRTADGTPFTNTPNIEASAVVSLVAAKKLFADQPVKWAAISRAAEAKQGAVAGFDTGLVARIEYRSHQKEITTDNVIGMLPGTDPTLADEYVVVTGHLDHEGVKPTPEEADDEIYNGAMDNATGIASILEVARLLAMTPPKRPVLFVALTAEEKGLVGSDYLAQNPPMDDGAIVANINLDMPIITYDFNDIVAFGAERSTMFPIVEAAAARANLKLSPDPSPDEGFFTRSDQYSFVKQGIPAVYIDLGFGNGGEKAQGSFLKEHYHKVSDEVDLIDFAALGRFAQVNYEVVDGVANMHERPRWKAGDFFGAMFSGPMEE
ncbi:MAG: M28 family peptidase [Alphaproteobacteria bacterium]|nr:M28 family peptidase [Alphaproteobacteria bacterium]